jgi:hypothetical protein
MQREDEPQGIKCKAGSGWIHFAAEVSENQANEVFLKLQKELPAVAASVFAFPEEKSRFLRLEIEFLQGASTLLIWSGLLGFVCDWRKFVR